jgi:hypothetical protein
LAIRFALIGTGNCGSLAPKPLMNYARFDLTGVWVSSDAKVGKDAGTGDTRLPDAMADARKILAASIDVVGSGLGVLQYPGG